jgi:hypothetical protein
MRQHIINQQGGAFCHSPRTTASIIFSLLFNPVIQGF